MKSIEYAADGVTVHKVEFKTASDYPPVFSSSQMLPGHVWTPTVPAMTVGQWSENWAG